MKFWQVDAFTKEKFKGNPAAVVVLENPISDALMQNIALEMNLSETAFVQKKDSEHYDLRWFTPNAEVDLCGHATLAAAHVLRSEKLLSGNSIAFSTRSGVLPVLCSDQGYELSFPRQDALEKKEQTSLVKKMLGCSPVFIGSNGHDCLAVVSDEAFLASYRPNRLLISELEERGFVLAASTQKAEFDYVYRAFFPKLNVDEDPVCGSANTMLAPYFSTMLGKQDLKAQQLSKRGGELSLSVSDNQVIIKGEAVTTATGELLL